MVNTQANVGTAYAQHSVYMLYTDLVIIVNMYYTTLKVTAAQLQVNDLLSFCWTATLHHGM